MHTHAEMLAFDGLAAALHDARHRLIFGTEAQMQEAFTEFFAAENIPAVSQPRLGATERPDFMVGGIAIELKVKGTTAAVERQLRRYAAHPEVTALILVTNRATHRNVGREIDGKPVHVVWLSGAAQ